jgi:hypothetical protein
MPKTNPPPTPPPPPNKTGGNSKRISIKLNSAFKKADGHPPAIFKRNTVKAPAPAYGTIYGITGGFLYIVTSN